MTMKSFVGLILAAGLGLLAGTASAARGGATGIVVGVDGKPEYLEAGKAPKPLKLNQNVYEGDTIKTGPNDRAAVAFLGGAEVRITGGSQFKINAGGHKPLELRTRWGKLWSRMIGSGGSLSVRTPAAVAAVRGTEADIEAFDRTTVKVYEGHVDLMNDKGKQSLAAGQMAGADANAAPDSPRQMSQSDFESWQSGISVIDARKAMERLQKEAEKKKTIKIQSGDKTIEIDTQKP